MGVKPITAKAAKSCAANTMAKQTGEVKGSKYSEADVIIDSSGGYDLIGSRDVTKEPDTAGTPGTDPTMGYSGGGKFKNKEERDWYNNQIKKRTDAGMSPDEAVQDYRDTFKIGEKNVVLDEGTPSTEGEEGDEVSKTTPDYEKVSGLNAYQIGQEFRRQKKAERLAGKSEKQARRFANRQRRLDERGKTEKADIFERKSKMASKRAANLRQKLDQIDIQTAQGSGGTGDYYIGKTRPSQELTKEVVGRKANYMTGSDRDTRKGGFDIFAKKEGGTVVGNALRSVFGKEKPKAPLQKNYFNK